MPAGLRSSSTAPFAAPYPTTDLGGGTEIGSRQDWYSSQRLAFLEQVHARSASALDGKRPAGRELRSAGVASVQLRGADLGGATHAAPLDAARDAGVPHGVDLVGLDLVEVSADLPTRRRAREERGARSEERGATRT